MIRLSMKGVVMQDTMASDCVAIGHNKIKSICWLCKQPVVGIVDPEWPGCYSMECKNCGHSALAYYDIDELHNDEPRPLRDLNPFAQIIFKRLSMFLDRIRDSRLLIADYNEPTLNANIEDSPGGFVLSASIDIFDRSVTLTQYFGLGPDRIREAVEQVKHFCDDQKLEARWSN